MKKNILKKSIYPAMCVLTALLLVTGCNSKDTKVNEETNKSTNVGDSDSGTSNNDSNSESVNNSYGDEEKFVTSMNSEYFVQKGEFSYIDTIDLASKNMLISCFGNNAGSGYFSPMLPPAPEQEPAKGINKGEYNWPDEKPSEFYEATKENKPANPYFSPVGWTYKLRQDEAVIIMGELPPECKYYSFINYVFAAPLKENKEYTERSFFKFGSEESGYYHPIFASMGEPVNMLNIKHDGDSVFGSKFVYIATGDKDTYEEVKEELINSGFSEKIINEAPFPASSLNMGLDLDDDVFNILMRISQPSNQEDYTKWQDTVSDKVHVYRMTPKEEIAANPYSVEKLRERGNGELELIKVPNAAQGLDEIRENLIREYGDEYTYEELSARIAVPEGMTGYQNDENAQGDNRDTSYLMTNDFTLNSDDDFIVVYGLNHVKTDKCTYANTVLYNRPMLNGIVSVYDSDYANSADTYLNEGTENGEYFYAVKMARTQLDEHTKIIPYSTGNEKGKYYGADNGSTFLLAYRAYVEPETGVGPSYYEIVYDRAIVFHKK